MTLEEAVGMFDIAQMGDVQAKFDLQKLRWLNASHIMKRTSAELLPLIKSHLTAGGVPLSGVSDEFLLRLIDLYKIRLKTLRDFVEMTDCFFRDDFAVDEEGKKKYLAKPENIENIRLLAVRLEALASFAPAEIEAACRQLAEERGLKAAGLIHPARLAISGKTSGAGLFEMMELLGKEKVLRRLRGVAP
jgi:glutamyl-tRNA synthetase